MSNSDVNDFSKVRSIKDEFEFWNTLSTRYDLKPEIIDRAALFTEELKPLNEQFSGLNGKSLGDILDLIETIHDVMDKVWKITTVEPYPEQRMVHVFGVIAEMFNTHIRNKLGLIDLWKDSLLTIRDILRKGQQICEKWVQMTSTLTGKFWSSFDAHPWKGSKHEDKVLVDLGLRTDQILTLRNVHEQIGRLLTPQEAKDMKIDQGFAPFASLQSLDCSATGNAEWKNALANYEKIMHSAEQRVAAKLRKYFASLGDQTYQLLKEFQRYKEVISRPTVSKELVQEREVLLGQLISDLGQLRDDFSQRTKALGSGNPEEQPPAARNMPEIVNHVVWVRQIITRAEHMASTSKSLLSDLPRVQKFTSSLQSFMDDLQSFQKEQVCTSTSNRF